MDINNLCIRIKDEKLRNKMNESLLFGKKLVENIASRIFLQYQNIFSMREDDLSSELDKHSTGVKKVKQDNIFTTGCDEAESSSSTRNSDCFLECVPKEELYFQWGNSYIYTILNNETKRDKQYNDSKIWSKNFRMKSSKCETDVKHEESVHLFSEYQPNIFLNEIEVCNKKALYDISDAPLINFDKILLEFLSADNELLIKENTFTLKCGSENCKIVCNLETGREEKTLNLFSGNNECENKYNDFFVESLKDIEFSKKKEIFAYKDEKQLMKKCIRNVNLCDNNYGKQINESSLFDSKNFQTGKCKNTENIGSGDEYETCRREPEKYYKSHDFSQNTRTKNRESNSPKETKESVSSSPNNLMIDKFPEELFQTTEIYANYSRSEQLSTFDVNTINKKVEKKSIPRRKRNHQNISKRLNRKSLEPLKFKSKLPIKAKSKSKNINSKNIRKGANKGMRQEESMISVKSFTKLKKYGRKISNSYTAMSSQSDVIYSWNEKSYSEQQQTTKLKSEAHFLRNTESNCHRKQGNSSLNNRKISKSLNRMSDISSLVKCNAFFSARKSKCVKEMKYGTGKKVQRSLRDNSSFSSKQFTCPIKKINPLLFSPINEGATLDDLLLGSKYREYQSILSLMESPETAFHSAESETPSKKQYIVTRKGKDKF